MIGRAARIVRSTARIVVAAALTASGQQAFAQPSEAAIKAAFLSKFAAYVEWPPQAMPSAGEPFILCLVGGDPFGKLIDEAARSQQVDRHAIIVKRLPHPEPGAGCNLAYVAVGAMLDGMKGGPILTVTDARNSSQRGMIHFAVVEGRVRFHIDEAAAVRRGLAINSRLLALALSVRQRN
jgi:hypothetical protein